MTARLPSLKGLEAFATVGKLQSIAKAARVLNITPSAVSHRISLLEAEFGQTLLERVGRGTRLTKLGERYCEIVLPAFENIIEGTERLRRGALADTLVVNVIVGLTANWVLPRLADFYRLHPELQVAFRPKTAADWLTTTPNDLRGRVEMRWGNGDWPGFHVERLRAAHIFPVCSPSLLRGPDAIRNPADLAKHVLIHITLFPDAWPEWLAAAGLPGLRGKRDMVLEDSELKRHAALRGLGVMMGVDALVEHDLQDGTLVAPFELRHRTRDAYYLLCHPDDVPDERIRAFSQWLVELGRAT